MTRIIVFSCITAGLVLGILQTSGATDLACFNYGNTKDYNKRCIVTKIEGKSMYLSDYYATSRGTYEKGIPAKYYIKDQGGAKAGDLIIVDAVDYKRNECYESPVCGKAIVVGSTTAPAQSGSASSLPPPPQAPVQGSTSLPPPPLPEGVQGQQQGVPTASLPAPPQQPQPQAQPPAQQEPQQPVTQTIDSTLNIFKKARDLFK